MDPPPFVYGAGIVSFVVTPVYGSCIATNHTLQPIANPANRICGMRRYRIIMCASEYAQAGFLWILSWQLKQTPRK